MKQGAFEWEYRDRSPVRCLLSDMDLALMEKILSGKLTAIELYNLIYGKEPPTTTAAPTTTTTTTLAGPVQVDVLQLMLQISKKELTTITLYYILYPGRTDTSGKFSSISSIIVS